MHPQQALNDLIAAHDWLTIEGLHPVPRSPRARAAHNASREALRRDLPTVLAAHTYVDSLTDRERHDIEDNRTNLALLNEVATRDTGRPFQAGHLIAAWLMHPKTSHKVCLSTSGQPSCVLARRPDSGPGVISF
jgi:hypothetical protein